MRNRRLALAAALLLAITSADGAALAVSGADFSSEEVAEAVFDEVEKEGLDNQDEVQEQVQTPEMDQAEDQPSEDSFSDASGMEASAEWQNEEATTADEALAFSEGEDTGITYTLSDDGKLVISGTGSIADDAFAGNTKITSVVISEGVTGIGSGAFTGCINLTSVTIPEGVTTIDGMTFGNCTSLTSVTIPGTVTSIEVQAFWNCSSLTSITIPASVTSIGSGVFQGCTSLTSVKLSEGLTRIGDQTFGRCNALETIEIPASVTSIGNGAFKNCAKLRSIRCYAATSKWQARYICDSNTTVYYSYNPNHTHSYKLRVTLPSDCTFPGSGEEICELCGDYYVETVPALGHAWDEGDVIYEASCESSGEIRYTCKRCNETKKEIIPATGHKWYLDYRNEPKCLEDGEEVYRCRNCYDVESTTLKATGHKFSEWKIIKEATVFDYAVQERTCSSCGETEQEDIAQTLTPTMKLSQSSIVLKTGQKTNCLKITGLAKGDSIMDCASNNTDIAEISWNGNGTCTITAGRKTGKTGITIMLESGYKKTITVKVQKTAVKTTKITGVPKTLKLKKNQKYSLKPVLKPVTSKEKITYKSSSSKVVKVDSKGRITAKKKGTAVITVKAGKKTVKCKVTVK